MRIFSRHKHSWNEIMRTYAPPVSKLACVRIPSFELESLLMGKTAIVWECTVCGEINKQECLGSIVCTTGSGHNANV